MSTFGLYDTFPATLRARAAQQPDAPAFTWLRDGEDDSETLSFAELDRRAALVAATLMHEGASGQTVLLLYPSGLDYIVALFGCFYAGAIAVPAYPPTRMGVARAASRIAGLVNDAGVCVALTTAAVRSVCESVDAFRGLRFVTTDDTAALCPAHAKLPSVDANSPCVLQYTSGSTGTPKGVLLRQSQLIMNQRMIRAACQGHSVGTVVTWLPPYHDMGLIGGILHPMFLGSHAVVMSPEAFIRKPVRWLRAISKYEAAVTVAPSFALDLCVRRIDPEARAGLDLSSLRVMFNGAEPIAPDTLDAFDTAFAPHGFHREAFYPCYGMAEATLIVSGGDASAVPVVRAYDADALKAKRAIAVRAPSVGARRIVGCGRALLDATIVVVDPDASQMLPERHIGEIWVSSRSNADGYWNQREATEHTFNARLNDGCGPYLRTGDLGFFDDAELFVTGRLKDLIIIRGRNHYPHDIERTVQALDMSLLKHAGAAFSVDGERAEQLVIVQEVDHRLKPDLAALPARVLEAVRQEHDIAASTIVLVKKGSLLKTSSGKIQHRAMRQAFLEGALHEAVRWEAGSAVQAAGSEQAEPTRPARPDETGTRLVVAARSEEAIVRFLCERIAAKTGCDAHDIDVRAPLAQYGVDSLLAAELTEELEAWIGRALPTTISYDHPTVSDLSRALARMLAPSSAALAPAARATRAPAPRRKRPLDDDPIVIVGMGCRFPGARNLHAFWQLLRNGVDAITEVPAARWDIDALYDPNASAPGKMVSRYGGFVEDIDRFDPAFFGISEREASRMDPQQRMFLEVAWEALEDACIVPASLAGSDTSVFAGVCSNDYAMLFGGKLDLIDADYGTGNAPSVVANRLSYFLNLKGPSMAIDTACSSSLVALQHACHSLSNGDTSVAIVGGVNAVLAPEPAVFFSKARALAPDGRCKAFDASADGFVRSEGCGVLVLKRLSQAQRDGDRIYAVVAGSAVNHDGTSNGLMAPSASSQEQLLRRALDNAEIGPDDLDYIEAHGVGAKLADLVELHALGAVLQGRAAAEPCRIGSVKTNIGHLEAASGVASVIKTALALVHEEIPPHLHLRDVHPDAGIEHLPIAIPTLPSAWRRGERARFAGVSTFGFGGTNAHVILREAPLPARVRNEIERPLHVLALSAPEPLALQQLIARYAHLSAELPIADLCYSANAGRAQFGLRATFVARTGHELRAALVARAQSFSAPHLAPRSSTRPRAPRVGMLFQEGVVPGGSARALYETQPDFRQALEHAGHVLSGLIERPLLEVLFDGAGEQANAVVEARYAPACRIAIDYSLYTLLGRWGAQPTVVLGQGYGEYAAAAAAGAMSWEDAFRLVVRRGEVLGSLRQGAAQTLTLRQFQKQLSQVHYELPALRVIAGSLGRAVEHGEALGGEHFARHMYHASTADDGVSALRQEELDACVVIGVRSWSSSGRDADVQGDWLESLGTTGQEYETLLGTLAGLCQRGLDIDWQAFDAPYARAKLALPTYPFQRRRCWLEFPQRHAKEPELRPLTGHPLLQRVTSRPPAHSGFVRKGAEEETG